MSISNKSLTSYGTEPLLIFVVDQNRERAYNNSMEDMLKLADVSCEELYWVEYVDVGEADADVDEDNG